MLQKELIRSSLTVLHKSLSSLSLALALVIKKRDFSLTETALDIIEVGLTIFQFCYTGVKCGRYITDEGDQFFVLVDLTFHANVKPNLRFLPKQKYK